MPKVLDEDQLRRKKALEEKRAARRRERDTAAKEGTAIEDSNVPTTGKTNVATTTNGVQSTKDQDATKAMMLELPEDAVRLIYILLTAADLGCLAGTCKTMTQLLSAARTHVVLARCCRIDTESTGRVKYMDLCTNEVEAQALLEDSYGGGDTGRLVPRSKYAKKTPHLEFCAFARYLQEAATGISYLSTGARHDPIHLPRFVQGRIASISPEHSLCRVGGDGKQSGAGGSGIASWGVGRRGQVRAFLCQLGIYGMVTLNLTHFLLCL